ncbi:1-deoxy-D-xylulose-5-phosphate reductoisomerase [Cohnella sp. CIP 111063]|uniref:1-deoxy-D-xylulose-5-phosphate reductoisomerase n=1 Tax=unclassified Cohnella TaxID=2636738 RepID=UPI000B8C15E2|nr:MULTISPECIES: 1-deoxy-D-xylulose-5-phosphate reductoisomerase [unclassified Cohnella]OXS59711.1 1-deoxy-D-xylulose-5-phosphate reductoisomerase [Cohnella sp. CIP 111063]PRX72501.1 1-deoxy-D-xylulose 5-phosphate reductoisomerase [Cohnella sp. SGD-V74]
MKKIAVLGSTGSIGTQTLDVISRRPEDYEVVGLAAGANIGLLLEQVRRFKPKWVSAGTEELAARVRAEAPSDVKVVHGEQGLRQIAGESGANYVVCALVGSLGLTSTLAAIEAGADIGLANKESLVTAGHLVMSRAKEKGVSILPVDSEHSAIFQCLNGEPAKAIKRLMLTASGGSFRDLGREQLKHVTVEDALKHPNWSMGAKVTIDSATMANKGLEVIEAHWLFGLPYDQIDVVLHPESIVHSMVEFVDTSVMAQLGNPDMRVPIQYALTYPDRVVSPASPLDLLKQGTLHFRPMSFERYPCLRLAYEAGRAGGTATTVFNAANEVAVARFLKGEIPFLAIEDTIERALAKHEAVPSPSLEAILEADAWARREAESAG